MSAIRNAGRLLNLDHHCAMSNSQFRRSIAEWDENEVQTWMATLGMSQYENHIKGAFPTVVFCVGAHEPLFLFRTPDIWRRTLHARPRKLEGCRNCNHWTTSHHSQGYLPGQTQIQHSNNRRRLRASMLVLLLSVPLPSVLTHTAFS